MYYEINEDAARTAKHMNSFGEYKEGSATESYRSQVDKVTEIAEVKKKHTDQEYHGKIDHYVDLYARRLAENLNKGYEIDSRVPSILISGAGNFPTRKKEKQNAARDRNMQEYNEIQGIIDKIRSIGNGGIRSDDENAIEKLEKKLAKLEATQQSMKDANKAIRMKDQQEGDAKLLQMGYTIEQIRSLREPDFCGRVGYQSYVLSNNNANIRRIRERIEGLRNEKEKAICQTEEAGDGYILTENTELCRIQFIFDCKPDEDTRAVLKSNGFRWAPSQGAWQRMLNDNGRRAAERVRKEIQK